MKRYIIFFLIAFTLFISSCSQSARNKKIEDAKHSRSDDANSRRRDRSATNVIKMKKYGDLYKVPIEVNGVAMDFIFDTGASDITISLTEALFLIKQGKLSENDIVDSQQYRIADGSISEGMVIKFKTVKIGNKTLHNINATIIKSTEAPLLLGQSALNKFGKISIDYKKLELKLE